MEGRCFRFCVQQGHVETWKLLRPSHQTQFFIYVVVCALLQLGNGALAQQRVTLPGGTPGNLHHAGIGGHDNMAFVPGVSGPATSRAHLPHSVSVSDFHRASDDDQPIRGQNWTLTFFSLLVDCHILSSQCDNWIYWKEKEHNIINLYRIKIHDLQYIAVS